MYLLSLAFICEEAWRHLLRHPESAAAQHSLDALLRWEPHCDAHQVIFLALLQQRRWHLDVWTNGIAVHEIQPVDSMLLENGNV